MSDENEVSADLTRKLQAKVIVGNVRKYVPKLDDKTGEPTGEVAPLFEIYGQANGTRRGESDNGPWVALTGRFEAVNITTSQNEAGETVVDGRVFAAPQAFLPEPVSSMLAMSLEEMVPETDGDGKPVMVDGKPKMRRNVDSLEFAFQVGVKATKTVIGYEYTVKPIIKHGGADPLADLRKRVAQSRTALPAPPKAPALEAPKAPAGGKGGKK